MGKLQIDSIVISFLPFLIAENKEIVSSYFRKQFTSLVLAAISGIPLESNPIMQNILLIQNISPFLICFIPPANSS